MPEGSATFGSSTFGPEPSPVMADSGEALVFVLAVAVMLLVLVAYRMGRKDGNAAAVRYFSVQRQIAARPEQRWPAMFHMEQSDEPERLSR